MPFLATNRYWIDGDYGSKNKDKKYKLTKEEAKILGYHNKFSGIYNNYSFPDDDKFMARIRKDYIESNPGIEKFDREFCQEQVKKE